MRRTRRTSFRERPLSPLAKYFSFETVYSSKTKTSRYSHGDVAAVQGGADVVASEERGIFRNRAELLGCTMALAVFLRGPHEKDLVRLVGEKLDVPCGACDGVCPLPLGEATLEGVLDGESFLPSKQPIFSDGRPALLTYALGPDGAIPTVGRP